ncbi:MAG: 50S ribosomal protein L19 [Patescibacteria group bacterium]
MELLKLTKQFGKKNIPQIRPGDTIRVSFKITEGSKTRIQAFEGICIKVRGGQSLNGSFTIRKIASGVGVERIFPIHSPLITKLEKIKSRKVKQAKLYFVRGLVGKKAKKAREEKDYKMWEEAVSEEELAKIEEEKRIAAEKKAEIKAKEKEALEAKFAQAVSSHEQVKEKTEDNK